jgi:hypothetical protein
MTDTTRDLIQRLADALEALQKEAVTTPHNQTIVVGGVAHPIPIGNDLLARDSLHAHLLDRARAYLAQPEPEGLPSDYIDSEHTGYDRELLEVFYRACLSEGGSVDEVYLRGLKAVIAFSQPEPEGPTDRELTDTFYGNCRDTVTGLRAVLARWGRLSIEPEPEGPTTDEELWELYDQRSGEPEDWPWIRDYARAVLARRGRSATTQGVKK